ncbi:MAG: hypothetical protein IJ776_08930 [Paludibacteraceae bacterium]|nr:hypothetical protein [Paludibacteraceae bacterium]
MKHSTFALMCLAALTMFTACNQTTPSDVKVDTKTDTGEELTDKVIVANLPVNVKFKTSIIKTQSSGTTTINSTITKIGADWVMDSHGVNTIYLFDGGTKTEKEDVTLYLRFDKDGKTLKEYSSGDGGLTWSATSKYSRFSTFAFINANKPFLDPSVNMGYGCAIDVVYKKTEEKSEICSRPCTKYTRTYVGEYDYENQNSVYLVDDATHLVFSEETTVGFDNFREKDEVTSWDESVTAFDVKLPE